MAAGAGTRTTGGGLLVDQDGRLQTGTYGIEDTRATATYSGTPAANGSTANLTGLTAGGVYEIEATIALTATAETQLLNLRLRNNGTPHSTIPTISGQVLRLRWPRLTANGNIDIQAIAAATGGAVYNVMLQATRVA